MILTVSIFQWFRRSATVSGFPASFYIADPARYKIIRGFRRERRIDSWLVSCYHAEERYHAATRILDPNGPGFAGADRGPGGYWQPFRPQNYRHQDLPGRRRRPQFALRQGRDRPGHPRHRRSLFVWPG